MIEPTQADIGRKVLYRDLSGKKIEEGVITSFNDHCVFVRYGSGSTSAGTNRRDLEWSFRKAGETAVATLIADGKVKAIDFCEPPPDPRSVR